MTLPGLTNLADDSLTMRARVVVAGADLPGLVDALLVRVVVDLDQHLPGMFELTFQDENGTVLDDAGLAVGTAVEVSAGRDDTLLISGEVTSLEADCEETLILTTVRGYERSHRLQRTRHSRTFTNQSDSEIATELAEDAGLEIGTVDSTGIVHDHIGQVAQTDWEFLLGRAHEIGYQMSVRDGAFCFRDTAVAGVPSVAGALSAARRQDNEVTATFKEDLVSFRPKVTGTGLPKSVEVRIWDPASTSVVVGKSALATESASIDGMDPEQLGEEFAAVPGAKPKALKGGGLTALKGLAAAAATGSSGTFVAADRPAAQGVDTQRAADQMAAGLAERIASGFAESTGTVVGNPELTAGARLTVAGVPSQFSGTWTVTNSRHVFDESEGGYYTHFVVSGRSDRSLVGLTSGGPRGARRGGIEGVVCGLVDDVADPDEQGRVRVRLPWLDQNYVTDWARTVHFGLGDHAGGLFLPQVGDEVLLAFEFGDPRRPYVLGGVPNKATKLSTLGPPVATSGQVTQVVERGVYTPSGAHLAFQDELSPGAAAGPPKKARLVLGGDADQLALMIDHVEGTVDLVCDPKPPSTRAAQGKVTIRCGANGKISIQTTGKGEVTVDAGAGAVTVHAADLKLTGDKSVTIESGLGVRIKAPKIDLN